ncbi:DUF6428 family protein [Aquimarina agarilytica]|uniref:DUF6428 family protein n=1 Tax=Aquimarina agarilytica TaxID=1087449 RepID=UPI000312905F|nr:DUF6428 family protein [Aquimarina agarilytica]
MMTIKEFIDTLSANSKKELLFEYAPGMLVGANYHITEVKSIHVASVDCGGQSDNWDETIIQLWESPDELGKKDYMTVEKALQILQRVSKVKAFKLSSLAKIEYSNAQFHTANLDVVGVKVNESQLILSLHVPSTDCKAKELCGVPEPLAAEVNSCAPGGGCC